MSRLFSCLLLFTTTIASALATDMAVVETIQPATARDLIARRKATDSEKIAVDVVLRNGQVLRMDMTGRPDHDDILLVRAGNEPDTAATDGVLLPEMINIGSGETEDVLTVTSIYGQEVTTSLVIDWTAKTVTEVRMSGPDAIERGTYDLAKAGEVDARVPLELVGRPEEVIEDPDDTGIRGGAAAGGAVGSVASVAGGAIATGSSPESPLTPVSPISP